MTSSLEDIKTIDLEEWLTLNTAASATKLKRGQSPDMENVWIDEKPGSVITAPGFIKVGTVPSGNPASFCINFFRTVAGTQTFVVSDNSTVWTTSDFQTFTSIITGLSSSFQLRGKVIRDKLWLTNGSDAVRTYDGTTITVLDGSGSTPDVPKGRYIDYHDERVWVYHIPSNRSQAAFSALTDTSGTIIDPDDVSAWPSSNTLQISEGDADFGTGMLLYRGYLHFFKQYSIWRLAGYDEYTYTRVKTRASTGTRFNESIQVLDSLVHFIGIDGIYIFDGEETERISDIIDPSSTSQTAFGFNQLQQPNVNNKFWEVAATADWDSGTVPTNVSIDDELSMVAADGDQADFDAGTKTQVEAGALLDRFTAGTLRLTRTATGHDSANLAQGQAATLTSGTGFAIVGDASMITDGDTTNPVGFSGSGLNGNHCIFGVTMDPSVAYSRMTLLSWFGAQGTAKVVSILVDGVRQIPLTVDNGASISGDYVILPASFGVQTYNIDFGPQSGTDITLEVQGGGTLTEINIFGTAFNTSGNFISKTLDLGQSPESYMGRLHAEIVIESGCTATFYTQSSADGITWEARQTVANDDNSISTKNRYLRWQVDFTSDGSGTPRITSVWLCTQYISAIHDTSGSIFSWGAFESDPFRAGHTVFYYIRGATTSVGVSSAAWSLIVPGSVPSFSTSFRYIQFKIFIDDSTPTAIAIVPSVTMNWVVGSGVQQTVLQNVASAYWRNRYWLSAAGPGATANDTILVRGKKTFGSPWMLKDWTILSFTRFQDNFYGCSSVDGSIYQLDTSYGKDGATMDSYFETGDFTFGGFTGNIIELLVEAERSGSYNLSIGVSVDGGRTFDDYTMDLTANSYDDNWQKRVHVNYTTTRVRFRFRTNDVDTPFQVHRCIVFYKLEGERGSIRGDYM